MYTVTYLHVSRQCNIAHINGSRAESWSSFKRQLWKAGYLLMSVFPYLFHFFYMNTTFNVNLYVHMHVIVCACCCMYQCVCVFVYTWLACDILLDLLWRLAGSPSLILSMLQPHDSMVFRDSLTGQ